jgi:phosphoglycolate phosphatase
LRYDIVLWDFDGTLADTFTVMVRAYNALAQTRGFRPIDDPQAARRLAPLALLRGLGIPLSRLPAVVAGVLAAVRRDMPNVRQFPGVAGVLEALHRSGLRMAVLSSNSRENVLACLRANGAQDLFEAVVGYRRVFGKGRAIKRLTRSRGVAGRKAIYVGDEVRDVAAARQAGIDIAAVTWGYNTRELLAAQGPDFLVDSPDELLTLLVGPAAGGTPPITQTP